MNNIVNLEDSKKNYNILKEMLNGVISQCNSRNLVEKITEYNLICQVKNAKYIQHFILENNLHIYQFINSDEQPINYYISAKEILEDNLFNGTSVLGYSMGGFGNSVAVDGIEKYSTSEHIDVVSFENFKDFYLRPQIDFFSVEGYSLQSNSSYSRLLKDCYLSDSYFVAKSEYKDYFMSGDLIGLINNFQPKNDEEKKVKDDIKETIDSIQILLQKKRIEKKGILTKLLKKNHELDLNIQVFSKYSGKGL